MDSRSYKNKNYYHGSSSSSSTPSTVRKNNDQADRWNPAVPTTATSYNTNMNYPSRTHNGFGGGDGSSSNYKSLSSSSSYSSSKNHNRNNNNNNSYYGSGGGGGGGNHTHSRSNHDDSYHYNNRHRNTDGGYYDNNNNNNNYDNHRHSPFPHAVAATAITATAAASTSYHHPSQYNPNSHRSISTNNNNNSTYHDNNNTNNNIATTTMNKYNYKRDSLGYYKQSSTANNKQDSSYSSSTTYSHTNHSSSSFYNNNNNDNNKTNDNDKMKKKFVYHPPSSSNYKAMIKESSSSSSSSSLIQREEEDENNKKNPQLVQVKILVDQYFQNIHKDTWIHYPWTHRIMSQLPFPEFIHEYQLLLSTTTEEEEEEEVVVEDKKEVVVMMENVVNNNTTTMTSSSSSSSVLFSISTMENKLYDILPQGILQMNKQWISLKYDAMIQTLHYIQGQPEYIDDAITCWKEDIALFFQYLPDNIVFDIGFHSLGISTMDEKLCWCPCGYKMKAWQKQFDLQSMILKTTTTTTTTTTTNEKTISRKDYCSDRSFKHTDFMDHVNKIGSLSTINGLLHRGISYYMYQLYKEYNEGYGHKALYKMGDQNYREIEAYERKCMQGMISQLQVQLDQEEKKRLETERIRRIYEIELKEGLGVLNKDTFLAIQDLNKNLYQLDLLEEIKNKPKIQHNKEDFFKIRKEMEDIVYSLRTKYCLKKKKLLNLSMYFDLQELFEVWYHDPKQDVLGLFQPIETSDHLIEFLYEWKIEIDVESSSSSSFSSSHVFEESTKNKQQTSSNNNNNNKSAAATTHKNHFLSRTTKDAPNYDESLTYFLTHIWTQLGNLALEVKKGHFVKLFEPTKGGLLITLEDSLKPVLEKAKAWYRAIGRIMIHALTVRNDYPTSLDSNKRRLIPSYILPRFYRNLIFRSCGPEDKTMYPWAELVNDLRDIELGSLIDTWIDQKYTTEKIFTQLVPETFIDGRKGFIDAWRDGVSMGGVFDAAGLMVKEIPECMRKTFVFTYKKSRQLEQLMKKVSDSPSRKPSKVSSESNVINSYFKTIDLELLDGALFAKGSITADDIKNILRVRFWLFNTKEKVMVPQEIVDNQKKLFDQIVHVLDECSKDDESFPTRLIEFFTGYAYLPVVDKWKSEEMYPHQPDGKKFELVIEFNGDECIDSASLPVARTNSKTMILPGRAYNGDASIFKGKLLESLKSLHAVSVRN